MSKLLIHEEPLQLLPTLAEEIGLNEAIVLQQVHYWVKTNQKLRRNFYDGMYWTYNTYEEWKKQFPFWSLSTIKRIFDNLRINDLVMVGNYNKMKMDRTLWYSVNYEKLKEIEMTIPLYQIDTLTLCQNDTNVLPNMTPPIPENNTENTRDILSSSEDITSIIEYLNTKANTRYKINNNKTVTLVKARLNEGYTIQDFKTVIDTKVKDWLNNPEFSKYLRPITLFGTKFENYLNESNTYKQEEKKQSNASYEFTEEDLKTIERLNNPNI